MIVLYQEVGLHRCGSIRLAATSTRVDEFHYQMTRHHWQQAPQRLMEPEEIHTRHPLLNMDTVNTNTNKFISGTKPIFARVYNYRVYNVKQVVKMSVVIPSLGAEPSNNLHRHLIPTFMWGRCTMTYMPPCSTVVHFINRQSLLFDVILHVAQPSSIRCCSLPSPLYFHFHRPPSYVLSSYHMPMSLQPPFLDFI